MEIFFGILAGILKGTPFWVWPLFILLLALGLRASRRRETSLIPPLLLPLVGLSNVPTLGSLPDPETAWRIWISGYLCGAIIGFLLQKRWIITRNSWRAEVEGEWLTLSTMMLIFWASFANGILTAVAPDIITSALYLYLFPAWLGLASGSFLGRPLRMMFWPKTAQPRTGQSTTFGKKRAPKQDAPCKTLTNSS